MYNEQIDILLKEALQTNELPPPALVQHIKCAKQEHETPKPARGKRRLFGGLAIAALCLLFVASAAGFGANLFGLRDMMLPEIVEPQEILQPDGSVFVPTLREFSLQGFAGSPEHDATVTWREWLFDNPYDGKIIIDEAFHERVPLMYQLYNAYHPAAKEMVHEIAARYGLVLIGDMEIFGTTEDVRANIGVANDLFLSEATDPSFGWIHESGTFQIEGSYDDIGFGFRFSRKGVFDTTVMLISERSAFDEWSYVNARGTELLLLQPQSGRGTSYMILDTESGFIVVTVVPDVLLGRENLTRSELEAFAEQIDFRPLY